MSLSLQESTNSKYKYYIWSKGDEMLEKSIKKTIKNEKIPEKISEKDDMDNFFDYRSFRKDLDNNEKTNDKAVCNDRLTGRDKIIQRSINPFLSNNDYLSDLSIQDEFLRPKNSSYGKI